VVDTVWDGGCAWSSGVVSETGGVMKMVGGSRGSSRSNSLIELEKMLSSLVNTLMIVVGSLTLLEA
jgi:hypothetical protein